MSEVLILTSVAAVAFAATNVDSLLLLVSLFAGQSLRRRSVVVGYGFSVCVVLGVAWFAAQIGDWIPSGIVNLLGVIPIAMGIRALVELWRTRDRDETPGLGPTTATGVGLLMLSISSDNFGVFIPLFAETPRELDLVILFAASGVALVWVILALSLSRGPRVRWLVERWGPRAVPLLLILMGIYILLDTTTDLP